MRRRRHEYVGLSLPDLDDGIEKLVDSPSGAKIALGPESPIVAESLELDFLIEYPVRQLQLESYILSSFYR